MSIIQQKQFVIIIFKDERLNQYKRLLKDQIRIFYDIDCMEIVTLKFFTQSLLQII